MKAFLSSTFKDLEPYRAAVIARLRRLDGVEVRCMEDFGSRAGSPKEFCLREARECDLFIGVIGHLYGFIPEGDETSITEQEYGAAEEAGRDRLLFVAPDLLPVPAKLLRGDSDPDKQEEFRARVLRQDVVNLDWSSPETLAAGVVEAVYNWQRQRDGGATAAPAVIPGINNVVYAQRCRRRWEAIDLSTLAAPGALDGDVELPKLSQVFIPQDCRRSRPAVSLPRDYLEKQGLDPDEEERRLHELRERWERQERLPALGLLARPEARKLVLLGDPGAGKSSLTRYVLLRLLDPSIRPDAGDDWRRALDGTWPVLVELRDLLAREAEGRCGDLISYLAYVGETQGFGFNRSALEAQLRDRPSLLIVDGLDEIFSLTRRRAVVEEVVGLETRFPDLRVLVTSRIAGFDARPFEAAGFTIATLDDLSADQIEIFAESWFALAFPAEPEKAERAGDDLLEALERRPQLAAIAGNPLILTIMAIIARHKRLARSRTQLYAQALEVLCYAWDYRRGLALPPGSPLADLQPEDTVLMLRRIAWRMQESDMGLRANAIGEADLKEILVDFFENEWRFPPPKARRAASEMVSLLQERNWILTTRGPDLYGFVHRTFLEYLCALELTKRFEAQELSLETLRDAYVMPRVDDDSYSEVIRLLIGQLPPRAADQLIHVVCPTPEDVAAEKDRLILAWQALGELEPRALTHAVGACDAALLALYAWLQSQFRPSHSRWILEAINTIEPGSWPASACKGLAFPFIDTKFPYTLDIVNRALARVIWLPSDDLRRRLFSLAESTAWTDRRGAVAALGVKTSNDPQGFRILRKRASGDEDDRVRTAAIRALASSFAEWPETFDLVRKWADEDDSEDVRITAVQELIGGFVERSETFDLLRKWAEEDDSEHVRATAVEGFGSFRERPEAVEIVRTVAKNDVAAGVRGTAIFEWSRTLESALSRHLLTRDLDAIEPGIDPREVIDLARVADAAKRIGKSPETIRNEYEMLVREHGFPLRLSWLEDGTESETVSP